MLTTVDTQPTAPAAGAEQPIDAAWQRARDALVRLQNPAGYWVGELQGDSILESEYILFQFILSHEADPSLPKIANYLRGLQEPHGGWSLYPGGPPDISGTVKAYFALKLIGDDIAAPHMSRARELILHLGGAEQCNSFTKFYFAALGQISYDACPAIPPEIVYLPRWFYFNLYHVSAWTRTMILPVGLVTTLRPVRQLPPERCIPELYIDRVAANRLAEPKSGFPRTWRDFFLRVDQLLKIYNRSPLQRLRERAIADATRWILDHMEGSEGLGAIFPPMIYVLIVLRALGYPDEHPLVVRSHKELRDFYIEDGNAIRLQPCVSPVWDTGLAVHALAEAGLDPSSDAARRATAWLLEKECRVGSDWTRNCPGVEPSGWFFEFANPHYPDVDDTAMAVVALRRAGGTIAEPAIQRGIAWLLAMQNSDGGWAAFDRTKDRPILEHIPFADHNAMQDPSCPDITGRVLECLGHCGFRADHSASKRAVRFITSKQDASGAWWGRWGINFVYGTWQVLTGLASVGFDMNSAFVLKAANWLAAVQNPDGGWGETAASYDDPSLKGIGPSTASQTAWGIMGLLAARGVHDDGVRAGVEYLVATQRPDGAWHELDFTGTGFPRVFYLRYHLYCLYFPLTALARYRRMATL